MHTYNADLGSCGDWVKQVLSTACVPFFFIASGFFFRRGMDRSSGAPGAENHEIEWFRNYLSRLVKMYLAWTLLSLPVAVSFDFKWFSSVSLEMRRLSVALYLIHFPLILLFDFYLTKGTLLDFPFILLSSVALYYLMISIVPKCSVLLFGYARH